MLLHSHSPLSDLLLRTGGINGAASIGGSYALGVSENKSFIRSLL